jgi:7-carboxy-7-deazaguanine synthase
MKRFKLNEWFESVYGEYPFQGVWMLFIRFAVCNWTCLFCDQSKEVEEEWEVDELLAKVKDSKAKWVCLTGGEPLIQVDSSLIEEIVKLGKKVVIETNGTLPFPVNSGKLLGDSVFISCSPKVWPVRLGVDLSLVNLKFLVGDGKEFWRYWLMEREYGVAGLQPVWGGSYQENLQRALEIVREHPDRFMLSVQLHKYIGVK